MFENFYLRIKLEDENAIMPTRAKDGDAGMDVYSLEDSIIPARGSYLFPLGWRYEIPRGFAIIVKEKSGRAVKNGLDCGACVCDSDYRGIVHVHLFNNTDKEVVIQKGEKIAQIIIVPVWDGQPIEVNEINSNTNRGTGGFGSTGLK